MKKAVIFLLAFLLTSFLPAPSQCQEAEPDADPHSWKPPYALPVPEGWTTERFPIPISFAPQISYSGVEELRFAPGWGKAASENYWSYAFLWFLDGKILMDTDIIRRNMEVYYTGLIAANGSSIPADHLAPVKASFKEVIQEGSDSQTFSGVISMTDYMQKAPLELRCRIHVSSCPGMNKTLVFHELSPRPFSHEIWKKLDKLWSGFSCQSGR